MAPVKIKFNSSPKKIYSNDYYYNFFSLKKKKIALMPQSQHTLESKKKKTPTHSQHANIKINK